MAESSNSQNNEDTELTMCDVLEEEQELEEDANAVLGGSDDTNCSYDNGYVSRQALYACIQCSGQEPTGVCLACSYKCHDGHEIVELYTKRNFRCDCGNSKFAGKTCSLKPDKDPINHLNKYNHNFKGLYCSCSRPYPDLEDDTPDQMIQCIMCEDWYHGRHIGCTVPDDYFEMICSTCMESHKFLYAYLNKFHYVSVSDDKAEDRVCNGTVTCSGEKVNTAELQEDKKLIKEVNVIEGSFCESKTETCIEENKIDVKNEIDARSEQKTIKQESPGCFLNKFCIKSDGISNGAGFWPENWRKELCQCSSCMDMYMKYQCTYLLHVDDTILAYEERGKSSGESQYDKGLNALSQLDRVKQMEAVRAYTRMKGQLKEYLKEFANNKRTVCESDIKEFFDRINKRQKLSDSVPHFCR